jgi:AraC-like DNA-binding protein
MLSMPLTGLPVFVLSNGAIADSTFPGGASYPFRNGFWVLNIMGGTGEIEIDGERRTFAAGNALITPPWVWHTYRIGATVPFIHAHFRAFGDAVPVPLLQDLGERAAWAAGTLRESGRRLTVEPERATAALWHILWQLAAGPARAVHPIHHPLVGKLLELLHDRFHQPLQPERLAQQLGVTTRHLNRLCQAAFSMPLAAYVRDQRLRRAQHLLEASETPIQEIAEMVGYPDLQHFSKLVRSWCGASPRQLRSRRVEEIPGAPDG